jgi:hypothetical protein
MTSASTEPARPTSRRSWHLKKDGIRVKAGQHVNVGDIIGLAD